MISLFVILLFSIHCDDMQVQIMLYIKLFYKLQTRSQGIFGYFIVILVFWHLKVVGGMTWCITSCDIDLDVDLLFQENSTIGQKM